MKVRVLNRQQATECPGDPQQALISISTPGDGPAALQEGWGAVLRLEFHDCAQADLGAAMVLFDEGLANVVWDFLVQHQGRDFTIHCDCGVSRSMAIGVFLRDICGAELQIFSNDPVNPTAFANQYANALVLRKLKERLWRQHFAPE